MSGRFPHLTKANNWPGLGTVDPFDLQVTFDPYLWGPDVIIHLAATPLDPSYRHIGGWESAEARDRWFDERSDISMQLDSEMHILPGREIKLPYAFEVLNRYNCIYVDYPPTPTVGGSTSPHRYYFFLTDVEYRSPSSTACVIILDEWTSHMFDVDMSYIELDRGHAPMAAVTVEDYLSNPLENSQFLTVSDEDYGRGSRLKYTAKHIVNQGPHWLVFCMTADPEQDPGEYGHREQWRVPTSSAYRVEGAISMPVFAVEPSDANLMINRINERAPQLLPSVQAVFLIPKRMVTTGTAFQFCGVSCVEVEPVQTVTDLISLTPNMFGYPQPYRDIAKLYTQPYAWLELTDETGRTQTIAVEDTTGRLRVSTIASILAPFLGVDSYVTGIGSSAEDTLTWDNMTSHQFKAYGNWTESLRHWNIPTYAIVQNSERFFEWTNHWQRVQSKAQIDAGYDIGIQTNNLNYALRGASLDRQSARLAEQQAGDSAQLALSNQAQSDTKDTNMLKVVADATEDISLSGAIAALQNEGYALAANSAAALSAATTEQAKIAHGLAEDYKDFVEVSGSLDTYQSVFNFGANIVTGWTTANNADTIFLGKEDDVIASTVIGGVNDAFTIKQTSLQAGYNNIAAEAGLKTAQAQVNAANIAAGNVQSQYMFAMTQNGSMVSATNQALVHKLANANDHADSILAIQTQLASDSLSTQQSTAQTMLSGDIAVARYQSAASKAMSDLSMTTKRDLGDESLANCHRAGRLGTPKVMAQPTGSVANYTRPQVIMARVMTEDPGAIAAAGDQFLRYGYRMGGRQWSLSNLTPMSIYTYWEGRVRIGGSAVNSITRETISQIFAQGTTIWRDPSVIGSTSIYDNRRRG